jgi:hypothetical protein
MTMWESIIVALITGGLSLLGVYMANRKSAALMEYRIEQLEKKVDIHNSVIDRTYKLEERTELQEAELHRQNERLKILEGKS